MLFREPLVRIWDRPGHPLRPYSLPLDLGGGDQGLSSQPSAGRSKLVTLDLETWAGVAILWQPKHRAGNE